jgi:hypothetical protein
MQLRQLSEDRFVAVIRVPASHGSPPLGEIGALVDGGATLIGTRLVTPEIMELELDIVCAGARIGERLAALESVLAEMEALDHVLTGELERLCSTGMGRHRLVCALRPHVAGSLGRIVASEAFPVVQPRYQREVDSVVQALNDLLERRYLPNARLFEAKRDLLLTVAHSVAVCRS